MEVLDRVMRAIDAFQVDKETFSVLSSFEEADEIVGPSALPLTQEHLTFSVRPADSL